MNAQLLSSIIYLLLLLFLIFIAHLLYKKWRLPVDYSRKFMHISGGLVALTLPLFIHSHWWVLLICSIAFLVLLTTYYTRQLDALHKTERKSLGSIIFPIPVYICFLAASFYNNLLLFFLPITLLTFADPAAEWGGKKWGQHTASFFGNQKTIAGTLSFAAIALLIGIVYSTFFHLSFHQSLLLLIGMPLITAAVECISLNGFDNITIPLSSLAILYIILQVS